MRISNARESYCIPTGARSSATLVWGADNVVLQVALSPTGPWTGVPGATSPFAISVFPPGEFFRLKVAAP
jgi:hypothetical protein